MKILISASIFIVFLFNLSLSQNLDQGLVAYYPFNGNANDESGNNNHGLVMGAVLTTDRFGRDSSSFEFNGTSSYITIPNSQTLQSPTTELSQVAWINIFSWSLIGSQFGPILMKSNASTNAFQYRLSIGPYGVNTAINYWTNGVTVSDTLNFNEWYMIVSTLKDDTVKTYVNGILIGEGELIGPINSDSRPLEIGRDVPGVIEVFHGKIDDIRIYNRAITESEIQELFGLIDDISKINPKNIIQYQLLQNYPNPFNPKTIIQYSLSKTETVKIEVYNTLGQKIETLLDKPMPAGYHEVEFNGQNLSSGIYLYKISAGEWSEVKKMLLVK